MTTTAEDMTTDAERARSFEAYYDLDEINAVWATYDAWKAAQVEELGKDTT